MRTKIAFNNKARISEKISTYVGLSAEELAVKSKLLETLANAPNISVQEVAEKISTEAPESDDVIVNVVKWGKAAKESEVKTVSPKKSNLVIEIDDDFEIKMCNFRDLAKKENNSDKDIKKN